MQAKPMVDGSMAASDTQSAAQPWIALVQSGMLVGKYASRAQVGVGEATHMAVADGRDLDVYAVDPRSSLNPPLGTEVEPSLWGWVRIN